MTNPLSGIHHITAIAGEPQENIDFYTSILGLRLVKVTVNFDDPALTIYTTETRSEELANDGLNVTLVLPVSEPVQRLTCPLTKRVIDPGC